MTATAPRRAALSTLRAIRSGALADRALRSATSGFPGRDRAWTRELVYGTLRLRARLDYALATVVRRPLSSLEADIRDVLRLGSYQLLEMHSVPTYAAVSQSVELAKQASRAAAGLVNGALNALARSADGLAFPAFETDPLRHLTTWGSHPAWLVRRWFGAFGADAARCLVEANNARPGMYVRPLGRTATEAVQALHARGIDAVTVPAVDRAVLLPDGTPLARVFDAVPVIVQDPAAMLVAQYVDPSPGARIADLCAAPGGKAIALADATPGGRVLATDIAVARARRMHSNLLRLGPLPVHLAVADAHRPPIAAADVVLLDTPCSGTGTYRRRPDARWRLRPGMLSRLCERQASLLDSAARIVQPGGLLVYSTCSIEAEENDDQVDAFLERHADFRPEPPAVAGLTGLADDGRLRVLPHVHGFDGAFAARLRRN